DLRRSPGEFHFYIYIAIAEVILCYAHQFGGDNATAQIFGFLIRRVFGDREHPAHFIAALLGVNEISHSLHFKAAFDHPVLSGQSTVQSAVFDVAGHLLRANQHALDFRVAGRGEIRARTGVDFQAGVREERECGLLQAAFGNADAELHRMAPCATGAAATAIFLVKQDRVPSWQTSPSPSTCTLKSSASLSQSVAAKSTLSRLPEVSPLVQSLLRVRLKNVTYPVLKVLA